MPLIRPGVSDGNPGGRVVVGRVALGGLARALAPFVGRGRHAESGLPAALADLDFPETAGRQLRDQGRQQVVGQAGDSLMVALRLESLVEVDRNGLRLGSRAGIAYTSSRPDGPARRVPGNGGIDGLEASRPRSRSAMPARSGGAAGRSAIVYGPYAR